MEMDLLQLLLANDEICRGEEGPATIFTNLDLGAVSTENEPSSSHSH